MVKASNPNDVRLLAVSVGNTRTSFATFEGLGLTSAGSASNENLANLSDALLDAARDLNEAESAAIVVASVNPPLSDRLVEALQQETRHELFRIGADVPIPIEHTLGPAHTTGQDRLLAALAAFEKARQACVVIDAGTAITVDFVDGEGVFHGGAIAPGARLMLRTLHEHTHALPEVEMRRPAEDQPFAKTTDEAMRTGALYAARGVVRALLERYAEAYGAYPQVVATGGDADMLFAGDELVEHVAPHLVLHGVAISVHRALAGAITDRAPGAPPDEDG